MSKPLLVVCVLLLAAIAAGSTSAANSLPANNSSAIRTYMLPDLSLKSVLSPDFAPQFQAALAPPNRHGFCRCSCGFPCLTSADCGGVSCDKSITCCAKSPGKGGTDWFAVSLTESSHKTAVPEVLLTANCNK